MGSRVQYSAETKRSSLVKIRILVVDDDSTALLVVTEVLKKWNYDVTGVKNPLDAISTLRMRRGLFDLIVTDYHMPIMNGLELQQRILEEFNLPVIMMSVDNNEFLMLKSLECGAAYFILKPVKPIDCKNIWQYAVARTKSSTKSTAIAIRHNFPAKSLNINNNFSHAAVNSHAVLSSMAVAHVNNSLEAPIANLQAPPQALKVAAKTNVPIKTLKSKENAVKKPKVAWTNFLHNRFLQAVNFIGIEKAVPKKILELMNIPGLTRQNVASHLQKYRIFLRRVAEKGKENQLKALNDVFFQNPSLITMPHPPSMMAATASRGIYPHFQMSPVRLSSLSSSSQHGLPWGSSSSDNIPNDWDGTDGFPSPATTRASRFNNQQMVFGATNTSVALSTPNMLPSPMDNQDISQYSATTDSTDQITGSKPATTFQYNPGGANRCQLSSTIPVSNSEKYNTGLSNCEQGSHGINVTSRFYEISSPLDLCTSNNSSSIAACQSSHLGINHQVQLNNDGIMSQVPDSTEIYGVVARTTCNNKGNYGENNNGCNMTGSAYGLTDSSQTPKLVDGDLFDMLIDYFPDLLNGGEEVMQTTPVIGNGSNGQAADLQVSDARISNINNATVDQLEDDLWDYEELKQPGPPSLLRHQTEQTVPGNDDAALDKDWDEVEFIESLLASVSPNPDRN